MIQYQKKESNHLIDSNNNLADLLSEIKDSPKVLSAAELHQKLSALKVELSELSPYIKFNRQQYSRNCVISYPEIEILVMCWLPGQLSAIHNHKGSACAVKVIKGRASEITYIDSNCGSLSPSGCINYHEAEVASSYDEDIHQFGNLEEDDSPLITLHCYSPKLTKMQIFSLEKRGLAGPQQAFNQGTHRSRT